MKLRLAIVDEANLETHGVENLLSHDPSWAAAYLTESSEWSCVIIITYSLLVWL